MDEQKNKWLGQQIKLIAEGDTEAISRIYTEIGKVMFAVATIYLERSCGQGRRRAGRIANHRSQSRQVQRK